jgi:hypothetical protein
VFLVVTLRSNDALVVRILEDIGISIIASGLAIDCPRYPKGHYAKYETEAAKRSIKLP